MNIDEMFLNKILKTGVKSLDFFPFYSFLTLKIIPFFHLTKKSSKDDYISAKEENKHMKELKIYKWNQHYVAIIFKL